MGKLLRIVVGDGVQRLAFKILVEAGNVRHGGKIVVAVADHDGVKQVGMVLLLLLRAAAISAAPLQSDPGPVLAVAG